MLKSRTERRYVPGTYTRIPYSLLVYRTKFRQIGKNVFVRNPRYGNRLGNPTPPPTLPELIKAYGVGTTLETAAKLYAEASREAKYLPQKEWVLATTAQAEVYQRAKARCDEFCARVLLKKKMSEIAHAKKILTKYGFTVVEHDTSE